MEPRNRFEVPLAELDAVRVGRAEQVEQQAVARPSASTPLTGALPHAYGDGGGGGTGALDADGD